MRVLIDCRFAAMHAGLGRYTRELVQQLCAIDLHTYVLLVRSKNEEWIPDGASVLEADIAHYSLKEQMALPSIIKRSGADLLFSPHFNVPLFCPIPFVCTVHDLILHRYPNSASILKQVFYRMLMKHVVQRAEHIIAVSTFTASELMAVYGEGLQEKVSIIGEGVSKQYIPASPAEVEAIRTKYALPESYFLYVGNAKQHKNVPLLIAAHTRSGTSTPLILVSGGKEAEGLAPLPSSVSILSNVSDEDMPALYSGATALVTASLYEGYFLPAVEALACGCPVIASNTSAIPEVVQGHGLLIEPTIEAYADAFAHPPAHTKPVRREEWAASAQAVDTVLKGAVPA